MNQEQGPADASQVPSQLTRGVLDASSPSSKENSEVGRDHRIHEATPCKMRGIPPPTRSPAKLHQNWEEKWEANTRSPALRSPSPPPRLRLARDGHLGQRHLSEKTVLTLHDREPVQVT
ncbi:uncharacterized protein LOC143648208 isoform X2 [Tamandua tetradactyla]|uniref:uncharacterized protein LOC143648208 isoform X2 n=1 Tax=Tamandua tetradactyla TaxID=48850 RepID=UPI00405466F9